MSELSKVFSWHQETFDVGWLTDWLIERETSRSLFLFSVCMYLPDYSCSFIHFFFSSLSISTNVRFLHIFLIFLHLSPTGFYLAVLSVSFKAAIFFHFISYCLCGTVFHPSVYLFLFLLSSDLSFLSLFSHLPRCSIYLYLFPLPLAYTFPLFLNIYLCFPSIYLSAGNVR